MSQIERGYRYPGSGVGWGVGVSWPTLGATMLTVQDFPKSCSAQARSSEGKTPGEARSTSGSIDLGEQVSLEAPLGHKRRTTSRLTHQKFEQCPSGTVQVSQEDPLGHKRRMTLRLTHQKIE